MTSEILFALMLSLSPYIASTGVQDPQALSHIDYDQAVEIARASCRGLVENPAAEFEGVQIGEAIDLILDPLGRDDIDVRFRQEFEPKFVYLGLDFTEALDFALSVCKNQPENKPPKEVVYGALQLMRDARNPFVNYLHSGPLKAMFHGNLSPYQARFRLLNNETIFDSIPDTERKWLTFDQIPELMREALIAAEDKNFMTHLGVDTAAIMRSAANSVSGSTQGGSTLTQQLIKNIMLHQSQRQQSMPELKNPKFRRKIGEFLLAAELTKKWGRRGILEAYFNVINFGRGIGVNDAARLLFGKSLDELNLSEISLLAGMPKLPYAYTQKKHLQLLLDRQAYVLDRMVEKKLITEKQAEDAKIESYPFIPYSGVKRGVPSYIDYINGARREKIYRQLVANNHVDATLNLQPHYHDLAEKALVKRLLQREGKTTGTPRTQGAVVIMDIHSGDVLAMVGGSPTVYDKTKIVVREFDRASMEYRQTGSTLKPFTYLMALEGGVAPNHPLLNQKPYLRKRNPNDEVWDFKNYDHTAGGYLTLIKSLANSINLTTARLLTLVPFPSDGNSGENLETDSIKALDQVRAITQMFGVYCSEQEKIQSQCPRMMSTPSEYYPIILGSQETSLLRLVTAYSRIANGGKPVEPRFIKIIGIPSNSHNPQGQFWENPLNSNTHDQSLGVDPRSLFQLKSMMMGVTQRGTARQLATFGDKIAGKTGTTDHYRDAWFVGFTSSLAIGVWVGNPNRSSLGSGATGGDIALPIFKDILQTIMNDSNFHNNADNRYPIYNNHISLIENPPVGLIRLPVNPSTGCIYKSAPQSGFIYEYFKDDQATNLNKNRNSCGPNYTPNKFDGSYIQEFRQNQLVR